MVEIPRIQIFVPAFEDVKLVQGLLKSIHKVLPTSAVTILDDSNSSSIYAYIQDKVIGKNKLDVEYFPVNRNPSTTYITCWNQAFVLAQKRKCEWFQIRHHDDYLIAGLDKYHQMSFTPNLLLNKDLVITPVLRPMFSFGNSHYYRYHCHPLLIKIFLLLPTQLLYFYNYLGPTASLYIRKEAKIASVQFNTCLRWLVDVDWYASIINQLDYNRITVLSYPLTISMPNSRSITSKYFKESRQKIVLEELGIALPTLSAISLLCWTISATCLKCISNLIALLAPVRLPRTCKHCSHFSPATDDSRPI